MSESTEQIEHGQYTTEQRGRVLSIARGSVVDALGGVRLGERVSDVSEPEAWLMEGRGCFVTLHHRHGRLRGCIGTFEGDRPLVRNVVSMAAASTRDPRFVWRDPVTLAEVNDLVIEVSVLTPMEELADPLGMRIGVDGIVIERNVEVGESRRVRGCFLPQVAAEQGWDAERTLSACCEGKMGLAADAWRTDRSLRFYRFGSVVMREERGTADERR